MAIKKATPAAKKELHAVEKRLDSKIDSVKEELHAVEKRLDQKIDSVENRLTQKIEKVAIEITQTNVRMDRMENNIMTGLREFRSELLNAVISDIRGIYISRIVHRYSLHADKLPIPASTATP